MKVFTFMHTHTHALLHIITYNIQRHTVSAVRYAMLCMKAHKKQKEMKRNPNNEHENSNNKPNEKIRKRKKGKIHL